MEKLLGTKPSDAIAHRVPRVLIVAPNASSRFGGEAFLPLKYFEILKRRGHMPRLLTHERNRDDLIGYLGTLEGVEFFPETRVHYFLWLVSRIMPGSIAELLLGPVMQMVDGLYVAPRIRRLAAANAVDVIHQPTPVSPLAPSGLHRFDLPLIIGPMNGGMDYPTGYDEHQSAGGRFAMRVGRAVARIVNRLVRGKRRAAVLLVANERTRHALPFQDHSDVRMMVENGVDFQIWGSSELQKIDRCDRVAHADVLQLAYVGRLVSWKCVDITLRAVALARARGVDVSLDIIGDGAQMDDLVAAAEELGLARVVRFRGQQSQTACAEILDALVPNGCLILNSIRECGGAVVLEAMALGLPVIASDWGGPADYIDADCGVLVPPIPRADFAERLAEEIVLLARNPDRRKQLGISGREKVRRLFDWERKVDSVIEIYREVTQSRP